MKKGMNSDEDRSLPADGYRPAGNIKIKPTPIIDLGDIKTRTEVLKRRLEPILDVLVIANMKIERCVKGNQDIPQTMIDTGIRCMRQHLRYLKLRDHDTNLQTTIRAADTLRHEDPLYEGG